MNPIFRKSNKKRAFTIVELLTVMSIIVLLIGLLVPALSKVKIYARKVKQSAQFHSIDVAMELFNTEHEGYPNSSAKDEKGVSYCGAMKLCEAMMGQDLLGFHPDSKFRMDGKDGDGGTVLYPASLDTSTPEGKENLRSRKGPYLQLENANASPLWGLYSSRPGNVGSLNGNLPVLCDVYTNVDNASTGKKGGMPILYYKANTTNTQHEPNSLPTAWNNDNGNIYNYLDNDELVVKGKVPWEPAATHPMGSDVTPKIFYESTRNTNISTLSRPYRPDSYILMSAGFDGLYGTPDDVFNFERE